MSYLTTYPNNIFVLAIILIFGFSLGLNSQLLRLFRNLHRELEGHRKGDKRTGRVDGVIRAYHDVHERGLVQPDPQVMVDKMVTELTVPINRFVPIRLPVLSAERLVRFSSSIPILLGLAGNFTGWLLALSHMRDSWPKVSASMDPNDLIKLLDSLHQPLEGLNTAFLLSVIGLGASLLLNLLIFWGNATTAREKFSVELEEYLTHHTGTSGAPKDMAELLTGIFDRFVRMAENLEQKNDQMLQTFGTVVGRVDATVAAAGTLVEKMVPVSEGINRAAVAIEGIGERLGNVVGRLESASGSFAGGADTLEKGLDAFGLGIHRLADAQDRSITLLDKLQTSTATTLEGLGDRLEGLAAVEQQLKATSVSSLEVLQGLVSPVAAAAEQLKEQYLSLERQSQGLELSITKLRTSGDRLESAAATLSDSEKKFVQELEQKLVEANQAQLAKLLESINDLNRCLTEAQHSYLYNMENLAGVFMHGLSSPVLQDLVKSLQQRNLDQSAGTGRG